MGRDTAYQKSGPYAADLERSVSLWQLPSSWAAEISQAFGIPIATDVRPWLASPEDAKTLGFLGVGV